jgi:hypothetical protein
MCQQLVYPGSRAVLLGRPLNGMHLCDSALVFVIAFVCFGCLLQTCKTVCFFRCGFVPQFSSGKSAFISGPYSACVVNTVQTLALGMKSKLQDIDDNPQCHVLAFISGKGQKPRRQNRVAERQHRQHFIENQQICVHGHAFPCFRLRLPPGSRRCGSGTEPGMQTAPS